ncbi:MAG: formylmethanofuran dehydrogenase subunit E family protein [Deltaproteobacteria bacterium]|nr:formylmethanofuran dehydrogenase subunit E family protein [Deltaproteobacteria bacterium]
MSRNLICGRSTQDFLRAIEAFHGFVAPGLVIGGFMVDWALERIGPGVESDAIVETYHCLPDAVQIFTPCTLGNGWLKVLDWDKFAMTLYDRKTLSGYRVWMDLTQTAAYAPIYNWFMRSVPKEELPKELVNETILKAGREILSVRPIHVVQLFERNKKGETGVCPRCGEAYSLAQGGVCLACQGKGYYQLRSKI